MYRNDRNCPEPQPSATTKKVQHVPLLARITFVTFRCSSKSMEANSDVLIFFRVLYLCIYNPQYKLD